MQELDRIYSTKEAAIELAGASGVSVISPHQPPAPVSVESTL
jgi:hypothetical protein